jgi:hypothetical protein
MMHYPIHHRRAHEGVVEYQRPLGEVPVTGEDGGGSFVAFANQFVEVCLLILAQGLQTEVIQDEEGCLRHGLQASGAGAVQVAGGDPVKERGGATEQDLVASATGLVA